MNIKGLNLFHNFSLKVLAFLIAVVAWLVVTNVNDPIYYMQVSNVPVRLLHTNLITDQGNVYTIKEGEVIPTVTVAAHRSIIDSLQDDNIIATADVEDMTSVYTVEIKLHSTKFDSEIESITGSIENVRLSIEKKKTSMFTLSTYTNGTPADGYVISSIAPDQNQVRVSGPESIVSSVASASATVDVSGATGSISTYSDIRLLDKDGNQIDTSDLTMNITSVKVSATLLPVKTVPVYVSITGTPASGHLQNGTVTVDPATVSIMGRGSVLAGIDSITIASNEINISNSDTSYEADVDIRSHLPEGVSLANSEFDGIVHVRVGIEEADEQAIAKVIPDIELLNIPDGYYAEILSVTDGITGTANYDRPEFRIGISGLADVISNLTSDMVALSLDVSAMQPSGANDGVFTGNVNVLLPDGMTMTNTLTARVRLTQPVSDQDN